MLQKRNNTQKELLSADIAFTIIAAFSGLANAENKRPSIMKKGAPGGCPTSNLLAVVIYSPQSHILVVCSMVDRNTNDAMPQTIQPVMLFNF